MRVDNYGTIPRVQKIRSTGSVSVEGVSGPAGDSVELSAHATDVSAAMEALTRVPDVRQDLVGELRQQLESGTLVADGDALAAKLLGQVEPRREP
jgi:flagellar biosynthesis anti-sigma factor FlgM